ncbi:hypothetical protein BD779DRAFT_552331 [Infundibulicybe gibba]|nr:hypothetical protein BD779DRAFT_552331 [Infundibulicybe gibba]
MNFIVHHNSDSSMVHTETSLDRLFIFITRTCTPPYWLLIPSLLSLLAGGGIMGREIQSGRVKNLLSRATSMVWVGSAIALSANKAKNTKMRARLPVGFIFLNEDVDVSLH